MPIPSAKLYTVWTVGPEVARLGGHAEGYGFEKLQLERGVGDKEGRKRVPPAKAGWAVKVQVEDIAVR